MVRHNHDMSEAEIAERRAACLFRPAAGEKGQEREAGHDSLQPQIPFSARQSASESAG